MHGKEFLLDCLRTFFTVVTLINVVMCFLGLYFLPENRFGYEAFAAPLIYGMAGTLPNLALYSKRELKVGELIVRKIIQIILIEVLVMFAAFYGSGKEFQDFGIMVSTALSILVIYVVATLFDWLQNYLSAKQMMEDLKIFQGNITE